MTREEASGRIRDHMRHHGIGGYPHFKLGEALNMALAALRPVSREQVEKVWRGEWVRESTPDLLKGNAISHCSRCWHHVYRPEEHARFCPHCGAPMTDEAVQMAMERLEELKNEIAQI